MRFLRSIFRSVFRSPLFLSLLPVLLVLAVPFLTHAAALENPLGASDQTITSVIGVFIRFIIGFVGSGALLMFVWGGVKFILARGNDKEIAEAKNIMTWATYGLIIIFFSFAIVSGITSGLSSAGEGAAVTPGT